MPVGIGMLMLGCTTLVALYVSKQHGHRLKSIRFGLFSAEFFDGDESD